MPKTPKQLQDKILDLEIGAGGDLNTALMGLDLEQGWQDSKSWGAMCAHLITEQSKLGLLTSPRGANLAQLMAPGKKEQLANILEADLSDNYIDSGLAAIALGVDKSLPLVAWAATNRRHFPGYKGELALLRTLLWANYDPSAQSEETGNTALHMMCSLAWGPGVYPRAVGYLLEFDADVNARNNRGDTPLITLSGAVRWSPLHTEAFNLLVNDGADELVEADDGSTALSILIENQSKAHDAQRAELIDRFS